jgi:glycosyltransferase involved in cell wall biosynthesis
VREQITPLILTYNEAPNIRRTLDKLLWARRIVVIDSGSTDGTLEMLRSYPQVGAIHHPFLDAATQCNFGLTQVTSPWVLSLDADYELSDELLDELAFLAPSDIVAGYRARFVYRIYGRSLRGSLYPPRTVLYRRERASYRQEGHTQRVVLDGEVLPLNGVIYHDDRKPLARWLASQGRYAEAEAQYLLNASPGALGRTDRIRLVGWPAPLVVFAYTLLVKGCLFDGWPGWYYALQRTIAEMLLALAVIDRKSQGAKHNSSGEGSNGFH